ncbi:unnamed protein product [Urochloa humidicola]
MMDQLSLVPYEGAGAGGGGGGKYKECMRNHAAAMGGQAFDGCGEYMPSSPDSLKCAACGCHRSFHRRAAAAGSSSSSSSCGGAAAAAASPFFFRPPPPPPPQPLPALPAPPHYHHQAALQAFLPSVPAHHLALPYHAVPNAAAAAPWLARSGSETPPRADDFGLGGLGIGAGAGGMVLGGGGGGGGSGSGVGSGSYGRKRFRTKFTAEQKEQMREFAERQGWRIQRNDDGALERFCAQIGVKRQVLKVWMHNHKNQLASNSPTSAAAASAGIGGVGGISNPAAAGAGIGGGGVDGDGDGGDDDDTDDSPPRAAVSSPSPSPISV